jgi:hypothetical protein
MKWPWPRKSVLDASGRIALPGMILDPPADVTTLAQVDADMGPLPEDYRDFLRRHNGGEGFIGGEYLLLWPAERLAAVNEGYEVAKYAPDLLLFGTNAGPDAYAFDRSRSPWPVVTTPFVGLGVEEYRQTLALSLTALIDLWSAERTQVPRRRPERDQYMWHIKPITLGGDPAAADNIQMLSHDDQMKAVRFYNNVMSHIVAHERAIGKR